MGRRSRFAVGAILALSLTVVSASQALYGVPQFGEGDASLIRRRVLSDLRKAQEDAGIFVDDAYLFEDTIENKGRRLQQQTTTAQAASILSNPTIISALLNLLQSGNIVGGFPGSTLNLPGGSPYGYAPSNASYCLFSTVPNNGSSNSTSGPKALGESPANFTCVEGTTAGPGQIPLTINGTAYVCSAPSATTGRKLLQGATAPAPATLASLLTPQTADLFFNSLLNAVGVPVWRCIIATTPTGNTTFGQATLATLNDLGVVAEHFLNYLNNADTLTYEQKIKNDFVSLTNPLYPTGPRLNFSIDFALVAKDRALWRSIFGFPAPPSPPPPAPVRVAANTQAQATATTGGTVPSGSTPANTGSSGASQPPSSGGSSSGSSSSTSGPSTSTSLSTTGTVGVPITAVSTPAVAAVVAPVVEAALAVFDGYLSNCQVVIGSAPGADGNFNRNNDFQAVVIDGKTSMSMNATTLYNGSVSYIIPASKAVDYAPLTQATRGNAQYCYDIATLLPVYNPIATTIVANSSGMAGNAISTVAVFGAAYGVTPNAVLQALSVNVPAPASLWTYDALGSAVNGSADGLAFLRTNTAVTNLVTAGANLLTNDSSVYASYAIIMNQALARKISYSPPLTSSTLGRRLLQDVPAPTTDIPADQVSGVSASPPTPTVDSTPPTPAPTTPAATPPATPEASPPATPVASPPATPVATPPASPPATPVATPPTSPPVATPPYAAAPVSPPVAAAPVRAAVAPVSASAVPAVDLNNATTVTDILSIALQLIAQTRDASSRSALNQGLTQEELSAVGVAVANLNSATQQATDPTTTQLSQYYAQTQLAAAVTRLSTGEITASEFASETGSDAISKALSGTLPGTLLATPTPPTPTRSITPQTQSSTTQGNKSSGLSHGGKVALATVFPIVAVIAIVAIAAVIISRRNRTSEAPSSSVWYRRPFARSATTQSAV